MSGASKRVLTLSLEPLRAASAPGRLLGVSAGVSGAAAVRGRPIAAKLCCLQGGISFTTDPVAVICPSAFVHRLNTLRCQSSKTHGLSVAQGCGKCKDRCESNRAIAFVLQNTARCTNVGDRLVGGHSSTTGPLSGKLSLYLL